jgi:ammonia channel protein AmtB
LALSSLPILLFTNFSFRLAYWEWNPSGWLYKLGVYDFAGSGIFKSHQNNAFAVLMPLP